MVTVRLTLGGMASLQAKIDRLQNVGATLLPAVTAGAGLIRSGLQTYPPSSPANQPPNPPPGSYYKRGTGTIYVHAGKKVSVSKRGVRYIRSMKSGVTVYKTSRDLQHSWSTRYTSTPNLARAEIGTFAEYAPLVHDAVHQASFHKRRGWPTVQALFQRYGNRILADMGRAIERALKGA
jgi:hypothetical protein